MKARRMVIALTSLALFVLTTGTANLAVLKLHPNW
jgi:hypothetical protein